MELNLLTFDRFFGDDEACMAYLAKQRWPNGVACIECGSLGIYVIKRRRSYECKDCGKQFNPCTNTPFQNSTIPLHKWFKALYLLTSLKKGISSVQLGKELGISQPAAWSMLHRLRDVMQLDFEQFAGTVEIDETYFTPKLYRRTTARYSKQIAIIGILERNKGMSRIRVLVSKHADATVVLPFIRASIRHGTRVHTDKSTIYHRVKREFVHQSINHSQWQWADGDVTTNSIESFWSHLKRGIRGIYIHVSHKHMHRYCDEFAFRHNTRWLSQWQRFDEWFKGIDRMHKQPIVPVQMSLFEK